MAQVSLILSNNDNPKQVIIRETSSGSQPSHSWDHLNLVTDSFRSIEATSNDSCNIDENTMFSVSNHPLCNSPPPVQRLEPEESDEHEQPEDEHPQESQQQPGEQEVRGINSNSNYNSRIMALEERVQDLETKLLVVSRLLQMQRSVSNIGGTRREPVQASVGAVTSPTTPPPPPLLQSPICRRDEQSTLQRGAPLLPREREQPPILDGDEGEHGGEHAEEEEDSGKRTPPHQIQSPLIRNDVKTSAAFPHLESPASFLGMDSNMLALSCSPEEEEDQQPLEQQKEEQVEQDLIVSEVDDVKEGTASIKIINGASTDNGASADSEVAAVNRTETPVSNQTTLSMFRLQRMTKAKRNLSFKILYGDDEDTYQQERRSDPNATASMTPSERRWLGASFIQTRDTMRKARGAEERLSGKGTKQKVSDELVRNKWLDYLNCFQESTPDVDVQMEEFVKVPGHVEGIMTFGVIICVDSFLYIFTILPIRFVWSLLLLLLRICSIGANKPSPPFQFHRRHSYQMIQVFLLYVIYQYVLAPISIGKLYHWIRGQAMIKLYVLIAIVEVFDRLMCSLGQDCLDSMYWNAVNRPKSSRMLISVAVVLLYATCHTLLLFLHVATLNVAMNSADIALLTLFISGNFAEIKSTVFKKYNTPALFKLTAADICERFKLGLFLGLVLLLNMCQGMDQGQFMNYLRVCVIVWCAELLADWVKHSFITKFNILPAKVYIEYALLMAGDFTGIGHEGVNLDHSHAVVKRIGLAQLPLVCVTIRLLIEAAKYATINQYWPPFPVMGRLSTAVLVWLVLLAAKVALGSMLHRISWDKLQSAPEILPPSAQSKKKKS